MMNHLETSITLELSIQNILKNKMINRYSRKPLQKLWSDKNKYENFLKIELAVIEAYTKLNIICEEDYLLICQKAKINQKRIAELEETTKHDVIAFTRSIDELLGSEKKWVHYSLTSTDVVDSGQSLILKDVNNILKKDIINFLQVLKNKALLYKNQPIIGRTHGMHAEVTSFGLKFALWYDEMKTNYQRFLKECENIEVIKLSGAVGNYANIPFFVEEYVANKFKLKPVNIATQVISRSNHASYVMSIALLASCIEKIAVEIRNLSRSEIDEVEEYFSTGQKGSSAMPHKKNPIVSENMTGCARIIKSYVNVALENNILYHERDISHSSAERIMLPDITTLLDYMLNRYSKVLDNLVVKKEKMEKNINLSKGLVFSGNVLQCLINKGLSREESYDLVQSLAFESKEKDIDFLSCLISSKINKYLTEDEIRQCFNINYYLKNVDYIYKKVGIEK